MNGIERLTRNFTTQVPRRVPADQRPICPGTSVACTRRWHHYTAADRPCTHCHAPAPPDAFETVTVRVEIDLTAIVNSLGSVAAARVSGKATTFHGCIRAKRITR